MKQKRRLLYSVIALILVISVVELVSYFSYEENYHSISLENASCIIPKRMWNPDSDDIFMAGHIFKITSRSGNYIIYGSQLEKYNEEDEKEGLINSSIARELVDSGSLIQTQELLRNNTCFLASITDSYEYSRSIFNSYRMIGKADDKYKGYSSYVAILKQNEMCFIEVIMFRDPEYLSEKEIQKIMLNINWHQNRNSK